MVTLRCLFKKVIGNSVHRLGLGSTGVHWMGIWLSHRRLQKFWGQVSLSPMKSCDLWLVRSLAGEELELLSVIMSVPTMTA